MKKTFTPLPALLALLLLNTLGTVALSNGYSAVLWEARLGHSISDIKWLHSRKGLVIGTLSGVYMLDRLGLRKWSLAAISATSVSVSPGDKLVAIIAGRYWHSIYVLNASSGREVGRIYTLYNDISYADWASPGSIIAGVAGEPRLLVYEIWFKNNTLMSRKVSEIPIVGDIHGPRAGIVKLVPIAGSDEVLVGTSDGYIALVSLISEKSLWVIGGLGDRVVDISVSGGAAAVAVIDKSRGVSRIYLVSLDTGEVLAFYDISNIVTRIASLGNIIVVGDVDGNLYFLQASSYGLALQGVFHPIYDSVSAIAVSRNSSPLLAVGYRSGLVLVYDLTELMYSMLSRSLRGVSTLYMHVDIDTRRGSIGLFLEVTIPSLIQATITSYDAYIKAVIEYNEAPCNYSVYIRELVLRDEISGRNIGVVDLQEPLVVACSQVAYDGLKARSAIYINARAKFFLKELDKVLGENDRAILSITAMPWITITIGYAGSEEIKPHTYIIAPARVVVVRHPINNYPYGPSTGTPATPVTKLRPNTSTVTVTVTSIKTVTVKEVSTTTTTLFKTIEKRVVQKPSWALAALLALVSVIAIYVARREVLKKKLSE